MHMCKKYTKVWKTILVYNSAKQKSYILKRYAKVGKQLTNYAKFEERKNMLILVWVYQTNYYNNTQLLNQNVGEFLDFRTYFFSLQGLLNLRIFELKIV